jgi:hypothetical protein
MRAGRAKRILALGAILALAAVPGALAAKGGKGKGHAKKPHAVTYVLKGIYAGDSTVDVKHGNRHARNGGFVGETVAFDLTDSRFVVADTSGDGNHDLGDVASGDRVIVKSRMPRKEPAAQPLPARKLVDQTSPLTDDDDASDDGDAPDPD